MINIMEFNISLKELLYKVVKFFNFKMVIIRKSLRIKLLLNSKYQPLKDHIFSLQSFKELHIKEIHKLFLSINYFDKCYLIQNLLFLYYFNNLIVSFKALGLCEQLNANANIIFLK